MGAGAVDGSVAARQAGRSAWILAPAGEAQRRAGVLSHLVVRQIFLGVLLALQLAQPAPQHVEGVGQGPAAVWCSASGGGGGGGSRRRRRVVQLWAPQVSSANRHVREAIRHGCQAPAESGGRASGVGALLLRARALSAAAERQTGLHAPAQHPGVPHLACSTSLRLSSRLGRLDESSCTLSAACSVTAFMLSMKVIGRKQRAAAARP